MHDLIDFVRVGMGLVSCDLFERASVAGHNDFPVLGFFPGLVFVVLREFCFVCVSFFGCFLNMF
jgi:hypothetical protein